MIDISEYFNPVSLDNPNANKLLNDELFCKHITIHTPNNSISNIELFNAAIIGVPEDRASINKGCAQAPDMVRQMLYQLTCVNKKLRIVDLGNLKLGSQLTDTYFGLRDVMFHLLQNNIIPIVIGGSQDLSLAMCQAYEMLKNRFTYTTVDNKFDFAPETYTKINSGNYLNALILENKNLFEYINLGHQACYLSAADSYLFQTLYHEFIRLGQLRNNIQLSEHLLRDSNIISIDLASVKHADAPAQANTSPNGFTAEEICQIVHYAGISENLKLFGLFEFTPTRDINNTTAILSAQIIWYFLDALAVRKAEFPHLNNSNFVHYIVSLNNDHNIEFFKSTVTQRWWVQVPSNNNKNIIIACTETDYLNACNNEIPDRWLKFLKKLN